MGFHTHVGLNVDRSLAATSLSVEAMHLIIDMPTIMTAATMSTSFLEKGS